MCGLAPGDEVICVDAGDCPELVEGAPYIVECVLAPMEGWTDEAGESWFNASGEASVWVYGGFDFRRSGEETPWPGYRADRFRKVERKTDKQSLTEWLSQPAGDTDRIDRSAPIAPRKRERA